MLSNHLFISFFTPCRNGFLHATDLGRIASNFYVKFETIEQLKDAGVPVKLSPLMSDDMVLGLIASSTEFSQLKVLIIVY